MINKLSTKDNLNDLTPSKIEEEDNIPKDPKIDNKLDMSK